MSDKVEFKELGKLKSSFSALGGLFWGVGIISLLRFVADFIFLWIFQSTKQMNGYIQIVNWIEVIFYAVFFLWFALRNKEHFRNNLSSYGFYLSGFIWVILPVFLAIYRMCISSINNPIVFDLTDAGRAIQFGVLVCLLVFAGLLFQKRSALFWGTGLIFIFLLSYLGTDVTMISREIKQAGGDVGTLTMSVKEGMVGLLHPVLCFSLGLCLYNRKGNKK